jgi:polyhydroxyalkanoate synthesis regulator phasin
MSNPYAKEMLEMWKKGVENSFQSLSMLQEQSEKMTKMMLEQGESVQEESRKFMQGCMDEAKKHQEAYEKNLKEQMKKMEELFNQGRENA